MSILTAAMEEGLCGWHLLAYTRAMQLQRADVDRQAKSRVAQVRAEAVIALLPEGMSGVPHQNDIWDEYTGRVCIDADDLRHLIERAVPEPSRHEGVWVIDYAKGHPSGRFASVSLLRGVRTWSVSDENGWLLDAVDWCDLVNPRPAIADDIPKRAS